MQGSVIRRRDAVQSLLTCFREPAGSCTVTSMTILDCGFTVHSLHNEQPTQNWSGHGESDCLIKTKHCDGARAC